MLSSDAMHVIHVLTAMNGNGILLSKVKQRYAWIVKHYTRAMYVTQRKEKMLSQPCIGMLNETVTLDVTVVTHAKHVRNGSGILHLTKPVPYVLVVLKHYTRAMYVTNRKAKICIDCEA